jgi:beta-ureidopropionase
MNPEVESVESILEQYIPEEKLVHVKRILYGFNNGKPVQDIPVKYDGEEFEVKGYKFVAREETNPPRIVKIGLIQNSIVLPTDDPIPKQAAAIREKIGKLIDIAGSNGVNIVCLQEAWTMPFAFCTREKKTMA